MSGSGVPAGARSGAGWSGSGGRGGRRWPVRWLAAGGGMVLAAVVGVAVVLQTTGDAACAAAAGVPAEARGAGGPAMGVAGVPQWKVPAAAPPIGSTVHRGKASYYSTSGGGNCSFPKPPADGLFVALSPSEYAGAAACGGYLDVTGPKGKVRVLIYDQCPGCAVGHIDLSKKAFARIADLAEGITSITYRAVVNPKLSRSLSLRFKNGTSQWWFALLVADHGNPLRTVEVRAAGRSWKKVSRADYNYWLADDGLGPGPFDIRLTDVYGQRATVSAVRLLPDREQRTGVFLYGQGVSPSASVGATPTAPMSASASPSGAASGRPSPSAPVTSTSSTVVPSVAASSDDC